MCEYPDTLESTEGWRESGSRANAAKPSETPSTTRTTSTTSTSTSTTTTSSSSSATSSSSAASTTSPAPGVSSTTQPSTVGGQVSSTAVSTSASVPGGQSGSTSVSAVVGQQSGRSSAGGGAQGASSVGGTVGGQSPSSAVIPTSITTTNALGSSLISATSITVPASQITTSSNERMSYMTVTVTDSSGATQESVVSSVSSGGSKSGTNVGAIAGGAAGGVLGLVALIALLWFCVFKKRRRGTQQDDLDDALFNAGPGQTDILDDEQPTNNDNVDPYTYRDGHQSPQMSQYAKAGQGALGGYPPSTTGTAPSLAPLMASAGAAAGAAIPLSRNGSYSEASQYGGASGAGAQGIARGPSTASTLTSSAGFAGRGAQVAAAAAGQPYSAYYQAASVGGGTYANTSNPSLLAMPMPAPQQQHLTGAQQKAREAALDRPVLRTANPSSSDDYYAPASASGGVYVHSDNGRYVEERDGEAVDDGPSELPPQ
ncbi:hypothetical protein QFC21_002481 [Naganishia friedmannii]|uniref:Uncharacterized protein n=1 Tax=Naganishia friedmannii TaxID=89922 RepID=A0ACC2VUE7_9TREE|nr:hypothetical protein QFC21_002481 [Naganishia friedmannii]